MTKSDIPRVIEQTIDKAKFDYRVQFTEYAGHAAEIARRCVASDVNIVVAVGGDGTVNEVARSLVHTETALGIVPCGSGNGLARHLCIPMDIRKAIAIINRCNIEALDYGVINSLPFFLHLRHGVRRFHKPQVCRSRQTRACHLHGERAARGAEVQARGLRSHRRDQGHTPQGVPDSLCQRFAIRQQCIHRTEAQP